MSLSPEELERYSRHLKLPGFGPEAQQKLKDAKVLVVGAGGLGAPLLQYLTAAGVGTIGLVEFDRVDRSNLQRQVLYQENDIGELKSEVSIARLKGQNSHTNFIQHPSKLDSTNALEILKAYDLVADGSDNLPTRYLLNDACEMLGKVHVYASIYQFEGQVSVFNYELDGKVGPSYRDLFPDPPPPELVPSCSEGGVMGALAGIIGSMQGLEVIKVITGVGEVLSGRLLVYDALNSSSRSVRFKKVERPNITELIDYEDFCGLKSGVDEIDVTELQSWMDSGKEFHLIDVREINEHITGNIGGTNIPKGEVSSRLDEIPKDETVVVYCRSGKRSAAIVEFLLEQGYSDALNLKGGMLAWKNEVEPALSVL